MSKTFSFLKKQEERSANQSRGALIFERKINEAIAICDLNGTPEVGEALLKAAEQFEGLIGVMDTGKEFAGGRFSDAYIQACSEIPSAEATIIGERAVAIYQAASPTIIKRMTDGPARLDNTADVLSRGTMKEGHAVEEKVEDVIIRQYLHEQIDANKPKSLESMLMASEDGELLHIDAEVMDLTEGLEEEFLSVEGKRKQGLLPQDFDTTEHNEKDFIVGRTDGKKEALFKVNDQGKMEIVCPHCESNKIYPVAYDTYGCFQCDNEFIARLSLGDNLDGEDSEI